ncbi:MAG: hypothetical protein JSW52_11905 [Candidatus Coatesbacteria bacterium]|nr:MAG: hypothetical protein JSW52_11905 [Candidatus Coatesbacteria bacterium]
MKKARFALKVIALAAALSVLPVGAAKYFTLYLTNGTDYYLDIWTADYSYAYLPPDGDLIIKTAREEIYVYVYFSAGQGITKAMNRKYETSYPPGEFGTDCDGRWTCYPYGGGGCINKTILEIEDGYPTEAHWTITWEDFFPPEKNASIDPTKG